MDERNTLSDPAYLEIQKEIIYAFEELRKLTEKLGSKTRQLGWKQRNALVSHVYSGYQKHEQLSPARKEWEEVSREYNIHSRLFNLMCEYRDLYGYFPEYVEMYVQIKGILNLAVEQEEYEVAEFLKKWKQKLFLNKEF